MEVLLTLACEVPQRDTAYLTRLLLELCKVKASTSEPVAIGMDLLYQRVDTMSQISANQVATLLAHYLNNTKFNWPFWKRWEEDLEEDGEDEDEEGGGSGGGGEGSGRDAMDEDGGGGAGGGGGETPSPERRFLSAMLSVCVDLNHSSER